MNVSEKGNCMGASDPIVILEPIFFVSLVGYTTYKFWGNK